MHGESGEDSNDECCICGTEWTVGSHGWVLCDTDGCPNTVCPTCTSTLSLSVSDMFYCPQCAGSGGSAAAVAGGIVATAVAACAELEKLPLSFKATRKILSNLVSKPDEMKYRRLRLENKAVKELIDLEPVLNILSSVGFTRTLCERFVSDNASAENNKNNCKEEVLLLEGSLPIDLINEILEIFDGLSNDADKCRKEKQDTNESNSQVSEIAAAYNECGKRKRNNNEDSK